MYKVFINDKPLYLTSRKNIQDLPEKNILKLEYNSEKSIHKAIEQLSNSNTASAVLIYSKNVNLLWENFCLHFKIIEAAGGIVLNKNFEILMIYRFERWDLPKGKIEKDEKPTEAALREVCEETGICDCKIVKESAITYHTYLDKNKNILKKTFWFEMSCSSFSEFKVQTEEGIKDAKWMNKEALNNALKNTYPSINELVKTYL